ncbi:GTPase Era [soil metagenome]
MTVRARKKSSSTARYRSGHVALVGRPNVGKSTLLNALLGERIAIVSHHPQTTRDRLLGVLTTETAQIAFLDTPGIHTAKNKLGVRMNREAADAMDGADLVAFVTDVGRSASGELHAGDLEILAKIPASTKTLFILNKVDRVPEKARLVPFLEAAAKAREFTAFVPISAKSVDGVKRVLAEIEAHLPLGPKLYEEDTLTDRPARWLVAELVREQVLARTREELPHGVAVVVESWTEPTGKKLRMPQIDLAIHVPKESHKKIIVGRGGAMLKEIGMRARARVEKLLGQRVVMKLWVRVTEDWYESEHHLRELGYGEGDGS